MIEQINRLESKLHTKSFVTDKQQTNEPSALSDGTYIIINVFLLNWVFVTFDLDNKVVQILRVLITISTALTWRNVAGGRYGMASRSRWAMITMAANSRSIVSCSGSSRYCRKQAVGLTCTRNLQNYIWLPLIFCIISSKWNVLYVALYFCLSITFYFAWNNFFKF